MINIDSIISTNKNDLPSVNVDNTNTKVNDINYHQPKERPINDDDFEDETGNRTSDLYEYVNFLIDSNIYLLNEEDEMSIDSLKQAYPNMGIETLTVQLKSLIDDINAYQKEDIKSTILKYITAELS